MNSEDKDPELQLLERLNVLEAVVAFLNEKSHILNDIEREMIVFHAHNREDYDVIESYMSEIESRKECLCYLYTEEFVQVGPCPNCGKVRE